MRAVSSPVPDDVRLGRMAALGRLEGLHILDAVADCSADPHKGRPLLQPPPTFERPWGKAPTPGELNLIEMLYVHDLTVFRDRSGEDGGRGVRFSVRLLCANLC